MFAHFTTTLALAAVTTAEKDYSKGLAGAEIEERFPRREDLTVETAMALHEDTLTEVHNIRAHHGARSIKNGGEAALPHWRDLRRFDVSEPAPRRSSVDTDPAGYNINPITYGADPTGLTDSTDAFQRATAALLATANRLKRNMSGYIQDLGGATIDLHGGQYVISKPIVVPHYYGNFHITGGTLRASDTFPTENWLIEVGGPEIEGYPSQKDGQHVVGEFSNVHHILLDGSRRAQGGIKIEKFMGATVGPAAFIINFNHIGSYTLGGHESMVVESWIAACYWSRQDSPATKCKDASSGVTFQGGDNYASNVIIFDYANVGITVEGPANYLQGVHSWNSGSYAFDVASNNRLVGCYIDTGKFHFRGLSEAILKDSLFLLGAEVVATITDKKQPINNVVMSNNHFSYTKYPGFIIDTPADYDWNALPPARISIENNLLSAPGDAVSSTATLRQNSTTQTKFVFDFSKVLVFPKAASATDFDVKVQSSTGFPRWILRPVTDLSAVTVEADTAIVGTVTVTAVQGDQTATPPSS